MTTKEAWNFIVKRHQENYGKLETVAQSEWENFLQEIFHYSKLYGEIETHRVLHIGSGERVIPDIIVKKEGIDLFDIELKQYNMPFDISMQKQLFSYLDLTHITVGIIVCQKLYIYVYDRTKEKKLEIEFIEDNIDGIKFIEIFSKGEFSIEKVENFIDSRHTAERKIHEIRGQVDEKLISELLHVYFAKRYNEKEINQALSMLDIKVKQLLPTPPPPPPPPDEFIETPDMPDFIIIKTCEKRLKEINDDFYYAVRYCWTVKLETVQKYRYVLGVLNGTVKKVYEIDYWQLVNDGRGRYEFFGHDAPEEVARLFINKKIPYKYRKPGMASPVVYSKIQR